MAKRRIDLEGKTTILNKNANGEGTIFTVGSGPKKGQKACQITIGKYPNGRPKRKTFYDKTAAGVKRKRDEYRDQHSKGLKPEIAQHINFGEYVLQYLELYRKPPIVSQITYENYIANAKNHILPVLGDYYLPDLDTDTIQAFYLNLKNVIKKKADKPLSAATVSRIHNIINWALEQAIETHLIPWNPDKATKRAPVKNRRGEAMPDNSLDKFLNEIDKLIDRWRAAFYLLLGTGLREGEGLALEWLDLDLEEGFADISKSLSVTKTDGLKVGSPKNDASVGKVPLPKVVVEALKKHKISQLAWAVKQGPKFKNKTPDGHPIYVFASIRGTHTWPRNFRRKYDEVLAKAGIPHIKLHSLRHTFATKLIEEGEDIRVVQALLRHTPGSRATSIYAHVTVKAQRKASDKTDSWISEARKKKAEK